MSLVLSLRIVLVLALILGGSSLGGIAYYYQARAADLKSQVSNLNNNTNGLNDQIAALKAQIANLTNRISTLQTINSQLNNTSNQIQILESELANANTQLALLETQLSDNLAKVQALEASFQTQLTALNDQLAADQAEIIRLQAQVAQLQLQLAGGLCMSGKTIIIGGLLDLSSALSSIGISAKDSSSLAISDVNSFLSSMGCTVKFSITVDDYGLVNSVALSELQSLAASGVRVVVGPLNSGTAQFLLSFADSNHIVLISPSSSSPALGIPNDYLFRTIPTDAAQSGADARMMIDRGANAMIIVQRHDSYGDGVANETAARFTALGGHVIDTIQYDASAADAGTLDWTATITSLYNNFQLANATYPNRVAVDIIAFEEFRQLITQANALHPSLLTGQLPWFGTDGVAQDSAIIQSPTGALVAKVRLPSTLFESLNNTKTISLYTKFASTYPGVPCSIYCLGAYDDVWLAALATLQAGSYNGTRIQSAMLTVASNYYGVTGWLGLNQNGDRLPGIYQIWKVIEIGPPPTPSWILAGAYDSSTDSVTWTSPP